jgi:glycosyltransferase involved in cell wall biosynthesis
MSPHGGPPHRITFFVHDLAGNAIGRVVPLAAALSADFEVEVVGPIAPGAAVYAPYRDQLPMRPLVAHRADPRRYHRLAALARGDVLFACKPLPATLIPALLAARGGSRAVILDVEDDEWAESSVEGNGLRARWLRLADPHPAVARLLHPLTRRAHAVTVSTSILQLRYGGVVIRHGPDERLFDPEALPPGTRERVRTRLGLPHGRRLALFAGVPRPHKGFGSLVEAIARPEAAAWDLVGVGRAGMALYAHAREQLGARFHHLDLVSRAEMPELLFAVDAVPVPQRAVRFAQSQLPAKLLDAMAMGVPVVATRVGDLAEVLGEGARGWLVVPDDPASLAAAMAEIATAPAEALRRGRAARAWFLVEASTAANRIRLGQVVRSVLTAGVARRTARGEGAVS